MHWRRRRPLRPRTRCPSSARYRRTAIKAVPRDENTICQKGKRIGEVVGVRIDLPNNSVVFDRMTIAGHLDQASHVEFKTWFWLSSAWMALARPDKASMYQASCWSSCSGPSWKSARTRSYYRPCLGGLLGSSVLGCAGKTISPSLLFLSQTSVGKRSWRLHRVSLDCEHFVLIHAAWDAGFIGLISKLRPPCRTPHTMRAILLASAIASLKRLSRPGRSLDPGFETVLVPALRTQ